MAPDSHTFNLGEALIGLESVDPVSATASFDVVDLLKPMQTRAEASEDEEAVKRLKWEQLLFSLQPIPLWTKRSGKYRLVCMLSCEGFEDEMARISKEALLYFKTRLDTCRSPMLRARYADVLWDRRDDSGLLPKDSAEYGRMACREYLAVATAILREPGGRQSATLFLNRAISVGIELGDVEMSKNAVASVLSAVASSIDPEYRGFAAGLAETLLEVRAIGVGKQVVENESLKTAAEALEKLAGTPIETLDLSQHCLGILVKLYNAIGEAALVNRAKERLAATWVFQADFMQPAMLWQSDWLESAARLYRETGNGERVGELMRRSRLASRAAVTSGEYKTISVPVELDARGLEGIYARYLQGNGIAENLRALALDDSLIPTAEDAREAATVTFNSNTLYARIRQSVMKGDRKVLETRGASERGQFETSQELGKQVTGIVFFVISPVLARLREERGLNHGTLTGFLTKSAPLPDHLAGLVSAGVERYLARDHTSTVYLLTPTLEGVIRETLMRHGIDVSPLKGGGYRESTLGSLLAKPDTERLFGKRIRDHLRFTLTDEDRGGMNLRNDVAHATIGPAQCDQTLADMLLHLHLLMIRFVPTPGGHGAA